MQYGTEPYSVFQCAYREHPSWLRHPRQCPLGKGRGPDGLYCSVHARIVEEEEKRVETYVSVNANCPKCYGKGFVTEAEKQGERIVGMTTLYCDCARVRVVEPKADPKPAPDPKDPPKPTPAPKVGLLEMLERVWNDYPTATAIQRERRDSIRTAIDLLRKAKAANAAKDARKADQLADEFWEAINVEFGKEDPDA